MYSIKHLLEDFIVVEKPSVSFVSSGDYAIFEMRKRDYTTPDAVRRVAEAAGKHPKDVGFAGNKDRKAVTTQYVSIFKGSPSLSELSLADISLTFKGYSTKKIALGDLEGNAFTITIRNMDNDAIEKLNHFEKENGEKPLLMPNYYGPQRFSSANHLIGRELIRKNFKEAVTLLVANDREHGHILSTFLSQNQGNVIGALRLLPLSTLKMFIHAYQSYLFNCLLFGLLSKEKGQTERLPLQENLSLPLIGFGTESDEQDPSVQPLMDALLSKEKVSTRDFINRQMPELSSEGDMREALFCAPDFSLVGIGEDDVFSEKMKASVTFSLKKSCYATTLLSYLFEGGSDILHDNI